MTVRKRNKIRQGDRGEGSKRYEVKLGNRDDLYMRHRYRQQGDPVQAQ